MSQIYDEVAVRFLELHHWVLIRAIRVLTVYEFVSLVVFCVINNWKSLIVFANNLIAVGSQHLEWIVPRSISRIRDLFFNYSTLKVDNLKFIVISYSHKQVISIKLISTEHRLGV